MDSIWYVVVAGAVSIFVGLITYIWATQITRVKNIEDWIKKRGEMKLLTEDEHLKICANTWMGFKLYLDEKFENVNLKIENKINEAVHKLNGKKQ